MATLTGTAFGEHPVLRTATLFPASASAAPAAVRPGWLSVVGEGVTPIEIVEAIRLLRVGSLVGLATLLTRPIPRPSLINLSPDMVMVANWRPGWHAFYIRGGDGMWRQSPVIGHGTPEGVLVADLTALEQAYGRPLPPGVLAMAKPRPQGVPKQLQTTDATIASAMANAPDPCRNEPGQRHHMIPAALMVRHQDFLKAINFTLDQGANLIKLPSSSGQQTGMEQHCRQQRPIHNGRTAGSYERAVSSQLDAVEGDLNLGTISKETAAAKVQRLMTMIRRELETGGYANVNDPRLSQTIAGWKL